MFSAEIIPMANRKYALIPVDKITVLNSRNRDKVQFDENIKSIENVGLLKPIVVNERPLEKTGFYELVCGEGRYLAYKALGKATIPAEVINCDKKKALLYSLVENIARVPPNTIWFANELKRMKDAGMPIKDICRIAGKTETYIIDYIGLIELGEERLIRGVEKGLFTMTFATIIAKSSTADIQHILMDAFDSNLVSSGNATKVRNLIEWRIREKTMKKSPKQQVPYSLKELKCDIARITQQKEGFVSEVKVKETRLLAIVDALKTLGAEPEFKQLVREEGLQEQPKLEGEYSL